MVAKSLFRPRQTVSNSETPEVRFGDKYSPCEQKLAEYEEQLAHLAQQKELHTLALKEMYQFLCKMDASFRAENQKLRDLIEVEQLRSIKLIEVTKGLWDIIELMDDGKPKPVHLASQLNREVQELERLDIQITDESNRAFFENPIYPEFEEIASMMATVG